MFRWSLVHGALLYVIKTDHETEITEGRAHWGCLTTHDGVGVSVKPVDTIYNPIPSEWGCLKSITTLQ